MREEAKKRKLIEIDATCGLVTKVHSAAKRYAERGYQIILIGHRRHVETIGTAGEAPEVTTVVETAEEVERLPFGAGQKIGLFDPNDFKFRRCQRDHRGSSEALPQY